MRYKGMEDYIKVRVLESVGKVISIRSRNFYNIQSLNTGKWYGFLWESMKIKKQKKEVLLGSLKMRRGGESEREPNVWSS